jgi:CubicO group peptidase (beta-lactamase class C family)
MARLDATQVHGECDERFQAVRDAFQANFDQGKEVGASVAATVNGEVVVDLWAGYGDIARTRPWERDTIACVYSTTKTMTALCALMLADRGELDVYAPVARYWPEFAANGKGDIRVRHLMSHTAGLPGWTEPVPPEVLYDWERATSLLAEQAPWWEPGTASGYHAVTQGYLVGEVVRRISGRSLGTFFREEVAVPLGADFHVGLPEEHDGRVAEMVPPEADSDVFAADPESIPGRAMNNPRLDASESSTTRWRRAEIPAAGGHGNARSVATIQAAVANGGEVNGVKLLSPETIGLIFEEQTNGTDLILGIPFRHGIGYGLLPGSSTTCFWGGWGGSVIFIDTAAHTTISYVMNKMNSTTTGDDRSLGLMVAFAGALAG